jgi:hypothetical protein
VDHKQTNNNDARLQVSSYKNQAKARTTACQPEKINHTCNSAKPHKHDYINAYSIMAQSLSMQLVYLMRLKRNCNGKTISTPHIILFFSLFSTAATSSRTPFFSTIGVGAGQGDILTREDRCHRSCSAAICHHCLAAH